MARLARELGVTIQSVAKVRDGGAFGSENNLKAARLFGVDPEWLATGRGRRIPSPSINAHSSQGADESGTLVFRPPERLSWEHVMQSEELPDQFVITAPDDALAPSLPRGTAIVMERAVEPQPGECVLVRDARGVRYLRRYTQAPGGHYVAQAIDDAYVSLHSQRDGLEVLAVMAWKAERRV